MKKPKAEATMNIPGKLGEVLQAAFDLGTSYTLLVLIQESDNKNKQELLEEASNDFAEKADILLSNLNKHFPQEHEFSVTLVEDDDEILPERKSSSSVKRSGTRGRSSVVRGRPKKVRRPNSKGRKQSKR